jgi:SAM-dependent methyltransferase
MDSERRNIWGSQIPSPKSVILDHELYPHISGLLDKVLGLIGLGGTAIEQFKKLAIEKAVLDKDGPLEAYEHELKAGLAGQIDPHKMDEALAERAHIIYQQIKPVLIGDSLLDIGCGNGLIANLAKGLFKQVQLLDVVPYVSKTIDLPFVLYTEGSPLPIDHLYDTVLLLVVLHHSNDPVKLLNFAWAATKKRLVIIESVVGVHESKPSVRYELTNSSLEHQIAYAGFVDWFYNRVLHDDVPVPYNFTAPEKWLEVFAQYNMRLTQTVYLGQDIDIGPEYHILFVLEK